MGDYKFLRKIMFDGESYITPTGLEDMLVNPLDFPAFYQYVLRKNDSPYNDIKPYRLVFMNGCEKVTLYKELIDRYDIELDPDINQSVSLGYIFPWLSPAYFDWIYFFKRFTKIITRTTNLYGFFRVVEQAYTDQKGNSRSNFYLLATNDAYVEGIPVDRNFYCKLINVAENTYDNIDSPLSSFTYNVPSNGYVGKLFFKEGHLIEKLKNEGLKFKEIPVDEYVEKMQSVNADGHEIIDVSKDDSNPQNLSYSPDEPPSKAELKLMGALLVEMIYNQRKFISESQFIEYLAQYKLKDLGKRSIQTIFADAKKELTKEIPSIKISDRKYNRLQDVLESQDSAKFKK